jgi:hypothetical protein
VVINIRLVERTDIGDTFDSLGRDWYGYDPDVSSEVLWEHNRGRWLLKAEGIEAQRWAAFNYEGRVVLVAELVGDGYETVADKKPGVFKMALFGRPLHPGHPVYDALIGTEVAYVRNPATYGSDPEIDDEQLAGISDPPDEEQEAEDAPSRHGQGRQLDARIRKLIEDAAQDRLMRYFSDAGWAVTDTRHNRPYDAEAVKGGKTMYLEAKGTQSRGETVIVTRNEVDHARSHPRAVVMGVWSGIRFAYGEVDPTAGEFRLLDFDPDTGKLTPRDFDWWLPN